MFFISFLQIQTSTHQSQCQGQAALSQQGEKFPVVKRRKFTGRKWAGAAALPSSTPRTRARRDLIRAKLVPRKVNSTKEDLDLKTSLNSEIQVPQRVWDPPGVYLSYHKITKLGYKLLNSTNILFQLLEAGYPVQAELEQLQRWEPGGWGVPGPGAGDQPPGEDLLLLHLHQQDLLPPGLPHSALPALQTKEQVEDLLNM